METKNDPKNQAVENLIKELGLENFSSEQKKEILEKITQIYLERVFLEIMEKIGENGREEYEKIIESGSGPEKVDQFFAEKIKNYDEFLLQIGKDLKKELTEGFS